MKSRMWFRVMMCLLACVVLGTGCRSGSGTGNGGTDYDVVDPTDLGSVGEYAHAERFPGGTPITDVQFAAVRFAYDSFQISEGEVSKIQKVAGYMRANPEVRLIADGHCDERGSREYNMSLGEYRALAVRAHLIGFDIDGARVQTRSFGEEQPVDPGHNEGAWQQNRRVEFSLFRP